MADIEQYTIMVDHEYQTLLPDGSMKFGGRGGDRNGKLLVGENMNLMEALGIRHVKLAGAQAPDASRRLFAPQAAEGWLKHKFHQNRTELRIPEKSQHQRLDEFGSAVSTPYGDIFSVSDLIKLADPRGASVILDRNRPCCNTSVRWDGGHLLINIYYTNKKQWFFRPVDPARYSVSVDLLPAPEYKHMYAEESQDGRTRKLFDVHGMLISTRVTGDLVEIQFQAIIVFLVFATTILSTLDKQFEQCILFFYKGFCLAADQRQQMDAKASVRLDLEEKYHVTTEEQTGSSDTDADENGYSSVSARRMNRRSE